MKTASETISERLHLNCFCCCIGKEFTLNKEIGNTISHFGAYTLGNDYLIQDAFISRHGIASVLVVDDNGNLNALPPNWFRIRVPI